MALFKTQFLVNTIKKVKLQYIHLYNFILDLYFTVAMLIIPSPRVDLEGKSVVIYQDTLMITNADVGDVLHLSNGAEISVKLAEKYLID